MPRPTPSPEETGLLGGRSGGRGSGRGPGGGSSGGGGSGSNSGVGIPGPPRSRQRTRWARK
ncbi:hypothetical protein FDA94_29165 [Herbidospora galbida]|uniref:Uncharacterized protein n=1 Tax=Herbidospora galbida TaxID=2575442 RepID=A0A4U3MAS5_9ACTN|nr:hypothetical protein FDA94_29165 [Herbidospora galbida]